MSGSNKKRAQQKKLVLEYDDERRHLKKIRESKNNRDVYTLIGYLGNHSEAYNDTIRCNAVFELGELKDSRAIDPLINPLKKDNYRARQIAEALVKIGAPSIEAMIIILLDTQMASNVRKEFAKGLGNLRDPRAIAALIATLKDEKRDIRKSALKALRKITGQSFDKDYMIWLSWWENNKEEFCSTI